MARKRRRGVLVDSISDSDENARSIDDFVFDSQDIGVHSSNDTIDSDENSSSDDEILNKELYKQCLVDYRKLIKLKRELKMKLTSKKKVVKRPKETFTRFSVTSFSKVINALLPDKKHVIKSYGFGSLLHFDKCFVPGKFAKWLAQQVDYKSGDIIIAGKMISLTPESVHLVLGIPLGGRPFPTDISTGKSVIFEKFKKQSIPSVMFFVDKITKEMDTLSDEDIFVCFMLVALTTFLCPNASQSPSQKHLGIFADIINARGFDWSSYILSWLFEHIKSFNRGKSSKVKDPGTLGYISRLC